MWLAAKSFSEGKFYEPCFWGQSYNSFFESLLAVPLTISGLPYSYALPVITTFLAVFPFFFLSYGFYKRGEKIHALVFLLFPLLFTVEYDLIASMSRGWVTGIFISALGFAAYFRSDSRYAWFWWGFTAVFGLWLNPNGIFLVLYSGYFIFEKQFRNPSFYITIVCGALLPAAWWWYAADFYRNHPAYVFHPALNLNFSWQQLSENFGHLDIFFRQLGLFTQTIGWLTVMTTPLLIGWLYFAGKKKEAILQLILFFGMIALLASEKSKDAHAALFFSGARFFLAFPLLYCFIIAGIITAKPERFRFLRSFVLLLALAGLITKASRILYLYPNIDRVSRKHWVSVEDVSILKEKCRALEKTALTAKADLLVFESDEDQLLNYGCPCMVDSFPASVYPAYERRTWRLQEEDSIKRKAILFVRPKNDHPGLEHFMLNNDSTFFLVRPDSLSAGAVMNRFGYEVRPH